MVSEAYKKRMNSLIKKARRKGALKTYKEFCQTDISEKTELTEEEKTYYISKKGEK